MKKRLLLSAIAVLALGLLIAAALLQKQRRADIAFIAVEELAPAETLLFAKLTDAPRTGVRWRGTELFRLVQEPEVQAFLERPLAQVPALSQWRGHLDRAARAQPRQAFLAVTSLTGNTPRFTAGISFAGRRAEVEALLAQPRRAMRDAWPAGKAELISHAGTEIEVFSDKGNVVAEAFRAGWYFVANDLALLQGTLDRHAHAIDAGKQGSLAQDELFQRAVKPLPSDADLVFFLRSGALLDRLSGVLSAAGQNLGSAEMSELQKVPAIAASTKLDGANFRDTIFLLAGASNSAKEAPMPRETLGLATPDTVLYYSSALPATLDVPASVAPLLAFVPALAAAEQALTAKGLNLADLGAAFGPELTTLLDWPQTDGFPTLLLSLAVRDASKAKAFTDALAGDPSTPGSWGRKEQDGATIYSPAATGGPATFLTPSLALTDKTLLIGLTPETLAGGLARLSGGGAGLRETPEFQAAAGTVGEPTAAFAFLDLRKLIDRGYGLLRPALAMTLALNPDASRYVDAGKLPATETLSRHLGPIVYSQSVTEAGTLMESVGALTFTQALFGGAAAAGAAAFPALQQQIQSGAGFSLPQIPAATPPAPAPEPPSVPPALVPEPRTSPTEAFHAPATNIPS